MGVLGRSGGAGAGDLVLALFKARGGGWRDLVLAARGGSPVDRCEGQGDHAHAHHEGEHPGDGAVPAGLFSVGPAICRTSPALRSGLRGSRCRRGRPRSGSWPKSPGPSGPNPSWSRSSSPRAPRECARRASASEASARACAAAQEALDGGRLMNHRRTYEVLVEDHGGELFVRTPAVAVVVGLPAVRERRPPRPPARIQSRPGGSFSGDGMEIHPPDETRLARSAGSALRMCPSPVTMYLVLVSSGSPSAPARAASAWRCRSRRRSRTGRRR